MQFDYDSHRDYYKGEDFPVASSQIIGVVFIIMGITGFLDKSSFLYPYASILYIVLAILLIAFPRYGNTWGKRKDSLIIQDGHIKWSFKEDVGEIELHQIKTVEQLVSALRINKKEGGSVIIPTYKILSKTKFEEFTKRILPQLKKIIEV
jgi:hypothetical protein